jgi:hypothetical protein
LYPVAGFGIRRIEPSGSGTIELVTNSNSSFQNRRNFFIGLKLVAATVEFKQGGG